MLQVPNTTDIIISLTNIFLPILLLTLTVCYYKKILKLFDFFSFDIFTIPSFGNDKKSGSSSYGKNKKENLC